MSARRAIQPAHLIAARHAHSRAASNAKRANAIHTLIDSFYQHVSREQLHEGELTGRHDRWHCFTATFTFGHGRSAWLDSPPAELTIDLDDDLVSKLLPVDAPWTPPKLEQLDDLALMSRPECWPLYPRLYVRGEGRTGRGGTPLGYLDDTDRPRGGIRITTKDATISYGSPAAAHEAGWRAER